MRRLSLGVAALCSMLVAALAPAYASSPRGKLPPQTLRGPENLLQEYPTLSAATPAQLAGAKRLLAAIRANARSLRTLDAAEAAGFDLRTARRRAGDGTVHYLHAEHRVFSHDDRYLDPQRPEALIYANVPGHPLLLVGAMFSMPRGIHGRTPGGPITRWHTHRVCADGAKRGLAPRADGSCPPGTKARQGSEMMHVWFTRDLRSAFAIHAPARELGLVRPFASVLVCQL
jgi:hypothetical protein